MVVSRQPLADERLKPLETSRDLLQPSGSAGNPLKRVSLVRRATEMTVSGLDMRALEQLLGAVRVGSVRVVAVFLVGVSAEPRRLAALVARHQAVTLQLASPGLGISASRTTGIIGLSYRHSIHDLTGRGRFTLFAWAALSALMDGAEGVRGLEGAVSMSKSMAARGTCSVGCKWEERKPTRVDRIRVKPPLSLPPLFFPKRFQWEHKIWDSRRAHPKHRCWAMCHNAPSVGLAVCRPPPSP